jgi:hypothetical protein
MAGSPYLVKTRNLIRRIRSDRDAGFVPAHIERLTLLGTRIERTAEVPDEVAAFSSFFRARRGQFDEIRRIDFATVEKLDAITEEIDTLRAMREELIEEAFRDGEPLSVEEARRAFGRGKLPAEAEPEAKDR